MVSGIAGQSDHVSACLSRRGRYLVQLLYRPFRSWRQARSHGGLWGLSLRSHGGLWGLSPPKIKNQKIYYLKTLSLSKNKNQKIKFTDKNVCRCVQIGMLVLRADFSKFSGGGQVGMGYVWWGKRAHTDGVSHGEGGTHL